MAPDLKKSELSTRLIGNPSFVLVAPFYYLSIFISQLLGLIRTQQTHGAYHIDLPSGDECSRPPHDNEKLARIWTDRHDLDVVFVAVGILREPTTERLTDLAISTWSPVKDDNEISTTQWRVRPRSPHTEESAFEDAADQVAGLIRSITEDHVARTLKEIVEDLALNFRKICVVSHGPDAIETLLQSTPETDTVVVIDTLSVWRSQHKDDSRVGLRDIMEFTQGLQYKQTRFIQAGDYSKSTIQLLRALGHRSSNP
ncbi:hypothetical protein F5Y18DRAFT_124499 [Xylariaceae sp. FL1019]|nr:hypothetical protein F5Y18DRAFT_124499 [Xylariaceae sp. FL1019]